MKLGTMQEEAAACRAAWANIPNNSLGWHCHHEFQLEVVAHAGDRIRYILAEKPEQEQALRLRLFRPANLNAAPASKAYKEATAPALKAILELHAKECPGCPFNGKTIFAKEKP